MDIKKDKTWIIPANSIREGESFVFDTASDFTVSFKLETKKECMDIETVDDLANQIGDWLGIFGCCKAAEKGIDCEDENPFCCRIGFVMTLTDRINKAVENDKKLQSVGLNT